jgi:hypothetical protein
LKLLLELEFLKSGEETKKLLFFVVSDEFFLGEDDGVYIKKIKKNY